MSILDDQNELIDILPIKTWLNYFLDFSDGTYEIVKNENGYYIVNLKSASSVDTYFYFKPNTPNIPTELFRFGKAEGSVVLQKLNITTLEGMPEEVCGHLIINHCDELIDLIGCSKRVMGEFECTYCKNLKTLAGAPEYVGYDFHCNDCPNLINSEFKLNRFSVGSFDCSNCTELKNLPTFPQNSTFSGYIDTTNCPNLELNEFRKLPDNILGNLYLRGSIEKQYVLYAGQGTLQIFDEPYSTGGEIKTIHYSGEVFI